MRKTETAEKNRVWRTYFGMKNLFFSLCLILIVSNATAQKAIIDTNPYVLEYHRERLALFYREPIVTGKIVFLGDSLIEFGDWKTLLNDSTVINRGIAGDITFGVLKRLDDITVRQPAKLFLGIGINDVSKNIPTAVTVENIFSAVRNIKAGSPNTQIFVQSILPTNDAVKNEYPDAYNKNESVVAVNKKLKSKARKIGFIYIDLYKIFTDSNGKLNAEYAEKDGLHLNSAGYKNRVNKLKSKKYI